ncbi:MAG: ATP-dependent Clp protease adaptor ClpS [Bacteroidales bacterium]
MVKENQQQETGKKSIEDKEYQLILYNDDVNTFDFVISTLMEVCGHDAEQAEQIAFIVHFKGKCTVKTGPYEKLKPCYRIMVNKMLTVGIQ